MFYDWLLGWLSSSISNFICEEANEVLAAKRICDSEQCGSLRLAEVLKTRIFLFFLQLEKNNSLALKRAFL